MVILMKMGFIVNSKDKEKNKATKKDEKKSPHASESDLSRIRSSGKIESVDIWETEYAGHAIELAKAACGKVDYLIAGGGDGTLNEVVNGCLEVKDDSPSTRIPVIGLYPQGTANDFIKSTGLTGQLDQIERLVTARSHRSVDVGKVSYLDEQSDEASRYFVNIADVGIGADVVKRINRRRNARRKLNGRMTFFKATIESFLRYRNRGLRLLTDGGFRWRGKALLVAIANGRFFSAGLCIAPNASIENGKLSITVVGDATILDFLIRIRQLRKGVLISHPEVRYIDAHEVTIDGEQGDIAIEADGEFLGFTPAKFEILPGAISFLDAGRSD